MVISSLEILHGCNTIQIYKTKPGGCNCHPHTIEWEICDNTLVDECNFSRLNQDRWLIHSGSRYVFRKEWTASGQQLTIYMAREILSLPRGAGHNSIKGDHKDFDTRNHTLKNLRVATPLQSVAYKRKYVVKNQFKGVRPNGIGFQTHIQYNGKPVCLPTVSLEAEAALMYNYAANILFGEFAHLNIIPEDEMPTVERQWELWDLVVEKLKIKLGVSIVDGLLQSRGLVA
jgi:hypothetical protein